MDECASCVCVNVFQNQAFSILTKNSEITIYTAYFSEILLVKVKNIDFRKPKHRTLIPQIFLRNTKRSHHIHREGLEIPTLI
jgi:hypothetical protein